MIDECQTSVQVIVPAKSILAGSYQVKRSLISRSMTVLTRKAQIDSLSYSYFLSFFTRYMLQCTFYTTPQDIVVRYNAFMLVVRMSICLSYILPSIFSFLYNNLSKYQWIFTKLVAGLGGSFGCTSDWWSGGHRFNPCQVRQHSFMEIDHEILSKDILSSTDSGRAVVNFWRKNVHKYWLIA